MLVMADACEACELGVALVGHTAYLLSCFLVEVGRSELSPVGYCRNTVGQYCRTVGPGLRVPHTRGTHSPHTNVRK